MTTVAHSRVGAVSDALTMIDRMADWHPMLATEENPPGVWTMLGPFDAPYGRVEIRRDGDRVFYRAWLRETELKPAGSLRAATMLVHRAYIATLSPGPPPGGIYPDLKGGLRSQP